MKNTSYCSYFFSESVCDAFPSTSPPHSYKGVGIREGKKNGKESFGYILQMPLGETQLEVEI